MSNNRKSLCEESMLVLVNILKLSSLSLARRTLVTKSHDDHDHDHNHNHESPPLVPVAKPQRIKRKAKRLQKPEQPPESKLSYVMLLHDNKPADSSKGKKDHNHHDHQVTTAVDLEGKAADYIKRFHEKNMNDLNNESRRRLHYVLPPPPRQVFKS